MESWNCIINAALLGTEKKAFAKKRWMRHWPTALTSSYKEQQVVKKFFWQTAALVYNYRQCGFVPVKKESLSLPVAGAEEKGYASASAHVILRDVTEAGSPSLLQLWLEQCAAGNKTLQPDFLPLLLTTAVKQKGLQPLVKAVGGKRGEWLTQFNEDWTWTETLSDEELWQTGSLTQRKAALAQIRKADPAKAREALQQTWPQENAAAKEALLEEMLMNAGDQDVAWLESLLNEKSAKVKEAALQVLKSIPSSAVVQGYWNLLKQSIRLTTSKGVLGIGSKTSLDVKLATVDVSVFKTGIEQVSNDKKISDDIFILQQLIAAVPPYFWEKHFALDKRKIVELFSKEPRHKPFIAALGKAAAGFNDADWMRQIIAADENLLYPDALPLLPQKEAENYALKFFDDENNARNIMQSMASFTEEWSLPFAKAVLRFTAKSPYQYHSGFYNNIVHLLPVPIVAELEKFTPKEEHLRHMWSNLSEHITKLLTLKIQILKAFNE